MPEPACDPRLRRRPRAGRAVWIVLGLLAAAVAVALLAWKGMRTGRVPQERDPADDILRERAAALYAQDSIEALEALRPLLERERPIPEDLIGAAAIHVQGTADLAKARELLARARELGDDGAALHFVLGQVEYADLSFDRAERHFERVLELEPDDLPTRIALGDVLEILERPREAEAHYRAVIERGVDFGGSWYMTAVYRSSRIALEDPARAQEAEALFAEFQLLEDRGLVSLKPLDVQRGFLGVVRRPPPRGNVPAGPRELPRFGEPVRVLSELAGAEALETLDLDNDGLADLLAWGPSGLAIGLQGAGFTWSATVLSREPVEAALALDLGNDDDLDVLFFAGGALALFEGDRAKSDDPKVPGPVTWKASAIDLPQPGGTPADLLAVDYDHEGDLDLLLVGSFGVRLLRQDGAGLFVDATAEAGLPRERAFEWCLIEDLDTDQDVDLLLGGPGGAYLASNARGGRFTDESARVSSLAPSAAEPIAADLDGDARPDLWAWGALLLGRPSGRFEPARGRQGELQAGARPFVLDLDLDGSLDVCWIGAGTDAGSALSGRLALGFDAEASFELSLGGAAAACACLADLDGAPLGQGTLALDLVLATPEGIEIRRGEQPGSRAVRLGFRGAKDNRRALGAVVELRAGPIYRRLFWRGEPELAGVGSQPRIDYVRVLWPNGVVTYDTSRELGDRAITRDGLGLFQPSGLAGSCPFLYTWNGERFEFVSDVLGITPLGLPMAPGVLVPPDHDEYVLVRAEQLRPKDGFLELQLTEELREVTYLDRIRIDAVDHPEDAQVFPNERFCFPPFPEPHVHTVREPLRPARAVDGEGRDWTAALAAVDGVYAVPFEPAPPQFQGLATPHALELEFEAERVRAAAKLRLVLTGWFYWTDASVNVAAARHPVQKFVPPILQVPDGAGGWRDAGPPIGFPAGKTKTMVVDVGSLLLRDDPRIRLFGTLRLYWDEVFLAVDGDDAPLEVRSLEPASALLWARGFSEPESPRGEHQPERFDWQRLSPLPRWSQHPGLYTRYGDVLPLLGAIDDRFAILGAGDALTVRFEARGLPPPRPGWRRDWLVFLDGWAKDRDPNTVEALFVEPLPFHGMSGYPYGPLERFPDSDEHRAWRRTYNTRPATRWVPLQAPERTPAPLAAPGS